MEPTQHVYVIVENRMPSEKSSVSSETETVPLAIPAPPVETLTPEIRIHSRGVKHDESFEHKAFIKSLFSGSFKQKDLDRMVSKIFMEECENYNRRYLRLCELKQSDCTLDQKAALDLFNQGPMYDTHCNVFRHHFLERFPESEPIKQTLLYDQSNILRQSIPPTDIYTKEPLMDIKGHLHYVAKQGQKASDALQCLRETFCLIDCNIIYQYAYYRALLKIVGKKAFNKMFSHNKDRALSVSLNGNSETPLRNFMSYRKIPVRQDTKHIPPEGVQYGTLYYFKNHKDYLRKHPEGAAQGYNVMLSQKKHRVSLFTALGFPGAGLSFDQIAEILLDRYNQSARDDFKTETLYETLTGERKEAFERLKESTITLDDLYANKGGWSPTGRGDYLDIEKLKREFIHLAPLGYRIRYNISPLAGALIGLHLFILLGSIVCITCSDQLDAAQIDEDDKFSPCAVVIFFLACIGGTLGYCLQRSNCIKSNALSLYRRIHTSREPDSPQIASPSSEEEEAETFIST